MKTKIVSVVLVTVLLCAACCFMSACPQKEKQYNITIKIACQEVVDGYLTGPVLEEWIFTPDVSELYAEREYDGKQYRYYIHTYNLPDHPRWSEDWLSPKGEGGSAFTSSLTKYENGKHERVFSISEKGKYIYNVYADSPIDTWKNRSIVLEIDIK